MNYKISSKTAKAINSFYHNVSKKYKNTYSLELMTTNLDAAYNAVYQIENGLLRRNPTISRWNGYYMATSKDGKWNFAYRIEDEVVYVEDACHAQNMHETKATHNSIMLTETQLKAIISEAIRNVLYNLCG